MRTDNDTTIWNTEMFMDLTRVRYLTLAGAMFLAACGGSSDGADAPAEAEAAEAAEAGFTRIINVQVSPATTERFVEQVRLTGVVRADRDVLVSAEETGEITETLVEKGERVQAGTPLARINDRIIQAQLQQAESQARLAADTWERRQRLWEQDRVGSELAYLEARSAAEQTAAAVLTLQERVDRTTIRAPFAGVVDDRMVEVGTLVSSGTPIARIVDTSPLKVIAGVPERYAPDIRVGAIAQVGFDVFPDREIRGQVQFVGTNVDQQSRTFPVELTFQDPSGMIKPMMVANVQVERLTVEGAVVVPQGAIVRVEEGYVVFVVEGEGDQAIARSHPVELGPSQSNRVVIRSGLEPGERLVVAGQQQVADGDRVRIVGGA